MSLFKRVIILSLISFLNACATAPITAPTNTTPSANINQFELTGRIAVRHAEDGFSGNIRWQHSGMQDYIALASPLGQTVATIDGNAQRIVLLTSDKKTYTSDSAENLTHDVLGWRLPLRGLRYWVLGQVSPTSTPAKVVRDNNQRIKQLTQDGWHIEFLNYKTSTQDTLPGNIAMYYGDLNIKLVIDNWASQNSPR